MNVSLLKYKPTSFTFGDSLYAVKTMLTRYKHIVAKFRAKPRNKSYSIPYAQISITAFQCTVLENKKVITNKSSYENVTGAN